MSLHFPELQVPAPDAGLSQTVLRCLPEPASAGARGALLLPAGPQRPQGARPFLRRHHLCHLARRCSPPPPHSSIASYTPWGDMPPYHQPSPTHLTPLVNVLHHMKEHQPVPLAWSQVSLQRVCPGEISDPGFAPVWCSVSPSGHSMPRGTLWSGRDWPSVTRL